MQDPEETRGNCFTKNIFELLHICIFVLFAVKSNFLLKKIHTLRKEAQFNYFSYIFSFPWNLSGYSKYLHSQMSSAIFVWVNDFITIPKQKFQISTIFHFIANTVLHPGIPWDVISLAALKRVFPKKKSWAGASLAGVLSNAI